MDQDAIAGDLVISPKTVEKHIEHILFKLGVHSRAQAVALALQEDLHEPPKLVELSRVAGDERRPA
jgi:DNA-binding NarL/FixJ family response regulator